MTSDHERGTEGYTLAQAVLAVRRAQVLVAEDDPEMRALLASCLRRDGYSVIEVSDGAELLDRLGDCLALPYAASPDLIVSDLRMPGASGMQVLAGLNSAGSRTPLVLITAFGDEETHRTANALGAAAVLDKPLDLDELRDTVLFQLARAWRRAGPGFDT